MPLEFGGEEVSHKALQEPEPRLKPGVHDGTLHRPPPPGTRRQALGGRGRLVEA